MAFHPFEFMSNNARLALLAGKLRACNYDHRMLPANERETVLYLARLTGVELPPLRVTGWH